MARTKFVARKHVPKPKRPVNPPQNSPTNPSISKPRLRPGEAVLRDIHRYQKSTEHLLGKLPFRRYVREITQNMTPPGTRKIYEAMWYEGYRFQASALEALQDAAEDYLVEIFQDCNAAAVHAGRVTIMPQDIALVRKLRRGRL
ncbi:hypothetical protein CF319_g7167 [Tilletia indica]|uniref:Core Histone H2A/H2B/H3 domain-containing protein n=1 Tax=Tilletia indica TaxID=43049 RepID=A0A177TL94_9BASI|nr:hypothetical protein CF319_g7167 [Tilletia indica]KAE8240309.1 hypothetical protein A4X13_0g7862 [Tilletia indica]